MGRRERQFLSAPLGAFKWVPKILQIDFESRLLIKNEKNDLNALRERVKELASAANPYGTTGKVAQKKAESFGYDGW